MGERTEPQGTKFEREGAEKEEREESLVRGSKRRGMDALEAR